MLVYTGMAADILEIFEAFRENKVNIYTQCSMFMDIVLYTHMFYCQINQKTALQKFDICKNLLYSVIDLTAMRVTKLHYIIWWVSYIGLCGYFQKVWFFRWCSGRNLPMPSSPFGTGASCRWESFLLQRLIILSPRRNILFFAYRILHYIRYSQNKIQFIFFSFVALELHLSSLQFCLSLGGNHKRKLG